jgi:hypothetical protein
MSIHRLHHDARPPMTVSWHGLLDMAGSESQVLDVTRDFLATVSPYDIARLPEPCRPPKMFDASDITNYAFVIVRHHCDDAEGTARVAHKLASFFTSASIRLAHLLAASTDAGGDSRRSA